jgi:hypothetical protein
VFLRPPVKVGYVAETVRGQPFLKLLHTTAGRNLFSQIRIQTGSSRFARFRIYDADRKRTATEQDEAAEHNRVRDQNPFPEAGHRTPHAGINFFRAKNSS